MQLRESSLHADNADSLGLVTQYRARYYPRVLMTRKKWAAASGKIGCQTGSNCGTSNRSTKPIRSSASPWTFISVRITVA